MAKGQISMIIAYVSLSLSISISISLSLLKNHLGMALKYKIWGYTNII